MAQVTADEMVPPATVGTAGPHWLDRPLALSRVNWEMIAWAITLPVAFALRVIWLESWPMTAAEAGIASAAWALLTQGRVAAAPPLDAGPVVILVNTFVSFLFGDNVVAMRLAPALVGVALVGACWWLRPFLGRLGALLAAVLLAISPLAIYESRRLTPEGFAVLGLLVLAICLLRLRAGGGRAELLIGAAAATLAVLSHFLALPLVLLLVVIGPFAVRLSRAPAPAPATVDDVEDDAVEPAPPLATATAEPSLALPTFQRADWLLAAAVVGGITAAVALMIGAGGESLLANLLAPLTAWTALAPPADRPPLYLPLLLLIYEPLILIGALASAWSVGSTRETPSERLGGLLIVFWGAGGLLLAALAGDRDPAQVLYALVPLAVLAGRVFGDLLTSVPWDQYRRQRGPVLSLVSALAVIALLAFVASLTGGITGTTTPASNTYAITLLLDFIIGLALVVATIYLMRPMGFALGGRIVAITLLAFLALYGVRSATALAFVQPASAVEAAVIDQPAPGLLSVVDRLERLSRDLTGLKRTESDVTGGHGLELAIDQSLAQPFSWYLRDYPARELFDPARGLPGNPMVVIVATTSEGPLRATLDRAYVAQRYPFAWSFPAGGIGGGARGIVRYLLLREPAAPAVPSEYAVYLRRDLADKVLYRGDPALAGAPSGQGPIGLLDRAGRGRAPGQFDSPRGIAADAQGNIVVVDTVNARVQKFDPAGAHLWAIGSTGNGPGQFGRVQNGPGPTGVAIDSQGNIFVADTWNHRIVKLDPQGKFIKGWGTFFNTQGDAAQGQAHPSDFYGPRSIAIGADDTLYVTDTGNKRVLVFDADGKPLRQFGTVGSGPANLNEPVGIAIDDAGTLYVADTHNGRIATFDTQGKPLAQWPVAAWASPAYHEPYIAVADDRVYVTNPLGRSVLVFDKQGKQLEEIRRVGTQDLITPTGITVAPDGSVYLVDTGAHGVYRLR
ncbi:MAG: 6-bladed beta-propeller [Chloroflexi bacterium]|nr:6-bladed beta-propeller [Chloroflexota bacterium]